MNMEMPHTLSRIGVIGDVHTESDNLDGCVRFLKHQNLDAIMCVGDIVDGEGCPNVCCEILAGERIPTVLGNHDQWVLNDENRGVTDATPLNSLTQEAVSYLESLPRTLPFDTVAGSLMLCHGLGEYNTASVRNSDTLEDIFYNLELNALYKQPDLRFVFNGHTHRRGVKVFGHLTVMNAGSLLRGSEPCFAVVNFAERSVAYFDIDAERRISESDVFNLG